GSGAHGAAGFLVPGSQGFSLRGLARAADVSRAVGGRPRESRERGAGSGERGARELASRAVQRACTEPRAVRVVSPRCTDRTAPCSLLPEQTLVVGPAVYDAGAACRSGPLVSRQRAPRIAGARRAAQGRSLRERRVRPVGRRARAPRSPAPHAPRGRRPLVARSGYGRLRRARPLLV